MVQNEINNMSFLTADNKSKMAKVGASLWEVDLARREGTPPGLPTCPFLTQPAAHLGHTPCSPPLHLPFPSHVA